MKPPTLGVIRSLILTLAATAVAAALAAPAAATVSPAEAELSATKGALWFQSQQEPSGQLTSDWALTATAAAEISAVDLRTGPGAPSAQDYYFDDWTVAGPGGAVTDNARTVLAGVAGGIQTSRLETVTTNGNEVAALVAAFDGAQIGGGGLINDDVFAILALHHAGAPPDLLDSMATFLRSPAARTPDGGWNFFAGAGEADTDMTGAAIGALCAAGDNAASPTIEAALGLLETRQDSDTGGFNAVFSPFPPTLNTDTTGWVASGLIQCGLDPQAPRWTTDGGETPLDFLVDRQLSSGGFGWLVGDTNPGLFSTFDATRPLAGEAFSAPPPAPADGITPAVRPAPAVAPGTEVPVSLVIDHGADVPGDTIGCRVVVPDGSAIEALLTEAQASAEPAGCVDSFATAAEVGGVRVTELNGAAASASAEWTVSVDGAPAQEVSSTPIGFGDMVVLQLRGASATPPSVTPGDSDPEPKLVRATIGKGKVRLFGGEASVALRCPAGAGSAGCHGTVEVLFRRRGESRRGAAGSFELLAGARKRLEVAARRRLMRFARAAAAPKVKVLAITRNDVGVTAEATGRRGLALAGKRR